MVVVDGQGIPVGSQLASASLAEIKLLDAALANVGVGDSGCESLSLKRLIADRAYDSDQKRAELHARGIDFIVPHRRNRKRIKLQDGRKLRRYRRRWKIERTFAWIGNYRRLAVRYERLITTYRAFFHIACALITLRFVLKHCM